MKRLSNQHLPRMVSDIQVTPLLDLMLLLLLTVVVLVPILQGGPEDAALAELSDLTPPDRSIELIVSEDLSLNLAGQGIEAYELIADLKQRMIADPLLGVVTRVPPTLSAPRLLEIMQALHTAGVKRTAVLVGTSSKF
jgi:biopolymer transport protein ExbD